MMCVWVSPQIFSMKTTKTFPHFSSAPTSESDTQHESAANCLLSGSSAAFPESLFSPKALFVVAGVVCELVVQQPC